MCILTSLPKGHNPWVIGQAYVWLFFFFLSIAKKSVPSGCVILHSYQRCFRITVAPHSCQNLIFSIFSTLIIVAGVWYLIVVMTGDVGQLFCVLWSFEYILLWCACSSILPTFLELGFLLIICGSSLFWFILSLLEVQIHLICDCLSP